MATGQEEKPDVLHVLMIDDNDDDAALIRINVGRRYQVHSVRVDTPDALQSALLQGTWDIALCDGWMPQLDVREALALIQKADAELPVIMVSGAMDETSAVALLDAGVRDFINKNELSRLNPAIRRELRDARIRRQEAAILQDMATSNKELQRFAHIAAHDMREPLRRIQCCSQLLAQDLINVVDEETNFNLQVMMASAGYLTKMIDDLLEYNKLNVELAKEPVSVSLEVLARNAWEGLRDHYADLGAEMILAELPRVMGVPHLLQRVFYNLLDNALKFHQAATRPTVQVEARPRGGFWEIAIGDNGIGIGAEHAERIFDVFQRLHAREEVAGTGIGLSICKRIIERHGGRIWLDRGSRQGACFRFTLPA